MLLSKEKHTASHERVTLALDPKQCQHSHESGAMWATCWEGKGQKEMIGVMQRKHWKGGKKMFADHISGSQSLPSKYLPPPGLQASLIRGNRRAPRKPRKRSRERFLAATCVAWAREASFMAYVQAYVYVYVSVHVCSAYVYIYTTQYIYIYIHLYILYHIYIY